MKIFLLMFLFISLFTFSTEQANDTVKNFIKEVEIKNDIKISSEASKGILPNANLYDTILLNKDTSNLKSIQSSDSIKISNDKFIGKTIDDLYTTIKEELIATLYIIWSLVNKIYFIILILLASYINENIESDNYWKKLNWFRVLPRGFRTLCISILLAFIFIWSFKMHTRIEFFSLFVSILATFLTLSAFGGNKLVRKISKKLGYKFDKL